jgi:hypothetical protein
MGLNAGETVTYPDRFAQAFAPHVESDGCENDIAGGPACQAGNAMRPEVFGMGYVAAAWMIVLGMFLWAVYLYFHWAGVDALPMQWGLSGRPTWYAARGAAVFFLPVLAVLVLAMLSWARRGPAAPGSVMLVAGLLLGVQALWVFLARRYV